MPNVKKEPDQKVSEYRRSITLPPPIAKRVERMAEEQRRPVTSMLRILVERGLGQVTSK